MTCRIEQWGMVDYAEGVARQRELVARVAAGAPHTLVLCEHPAVITCGRKASDANLLASRKDLCLKQIRVETVDRGGDVTLHAPGQLVIYPVVDLKRDGRDVLGYLRKLEQLGVDLLRDFDIVATGDDDRRGLWVDGNKIASIGIGLSRWVTYHGMALNVNNDLELFRLIRPCGLDVRMVSMSSLLKRSINMDDVCQRVEILFPRVFQL